MGSSISHFKAPIIAALIIFLVEVALAIAPFAHHPDSGNWFESTFYQEPGVQKVILWEKLTTLAQSKADVVVVGDSSSLHGFDPATFNEYAEGLRAVNLSCCSDMGFTGYLSTARVALMKNPDARALVLNVSPRARQAEKSKLARQIEDAFLSPWRFINPPSGAWRQAVSSRLFYTQGNAGHFMRPGSDVRERFGSYETLASQIRESSGWLSLRQEDQEPMEYHACGLNPQGVTALIKAIGQTRELAHEFSVRPVILFSPVMCRMNEEDQVQARRVSDALSAYQDITVPLAFGEFWRIKYFNDRFHLNEAGSRRFSTETGKAFAIAAKERP